MTHWRGNEDPGVLWLVRVIEQLVTGVVEQARASKDHHEEGKEACKTRNGHIVKKPENEKKPA